MIKAEHHILITGAAGFIGSCMALHLQRLGYHNLLLMDDFSREDKRPNHEPVEALERIERADWNAWAKRRPAPDWIIHLGARTDTTEMNAEIHRVLNLEFSQKVWTYCSERQIPLLYASSAATYGDGALGYSDNHELPFQLKPLNPYGESKNDFDRWALRQEKTPPHWYGLKFFNVFGPNEYHKGRMASVVFHAFRQIRETGALKLFRSHRPDYGDGEQRRDFIYIKDLLNLMDWFLHHTPASGLYNAGTGKASSFNELAAAIFDAMDKPVRLQYFDTPADIREKYQYFTEADMAKVKAAGYGTPFHTLQHSVADYVRQYLETGAHY